MSDQNKELFKEISNLATEQRNSNSTDIDFASTSEILKIINNEDKNVPIAVEKELPFIEIAVDKNISLNCLLLKAPSSKGVVLYLHGTRGSNRRCLRQALWPTSMSR